MSRRALLLLVVLVATALAIVLALWTSASLPAAAPPLDETAVLDAFASPDPERVRAALTSVRATRPPPIDWLMKQATSENRGVREWSIHALGDIAPQEPRVVDLLIAAFEDDDDYVRWKAARALGNIGALAERALPLLEPSAQAEDEVEVVRATAIRAVRQIRAGLEGTR